MRENYHNATESRRSNISNLPDFDDIRKIRNEVRNSESLQQSRNWKDDPYWIQPIIEGYVQRLPAFFDIVELAAGNFKHFDYHPLPPSEDYAENPIYSESSEDSNLEVIQAVELGSTENE